MDLLRIEWPSGIVQTLTNVAPNQILTVLEHQADATNPRIQRECCKRQSAATNESPLR